MGGRKAKGRVPVAALRVVEMTESCAPIFWWWFRRVWLDCPSGVFDSACGCWLLLLRAGVAPVSGMRLNTLLISR